MAEATPARPTEPDDMNDDGTLEIGFLRRYVRFAYGRLYPSFRNIDESAQEDQARHRRLTFWASVLGAFAILLGLLGLMVGDAPLPLVIAELVLALLTAGFVLYGVYSYRREDWLLHRWQAEQLRLLKYSFLLDPRLWKSEAAESHLSEEDLDRRREAINALDEEDLAGLSHDERVPNFPTPADCAGLGRGEIEPLVAYYRKHRLLNQIDYFRKKIRTTRKWYDRPEALPMFFFGGVVFVLLHALWEFAQRAAGVHGESSSGRAFGRILVLASASLPTIWAAIRTNRQAQEFSRNLLRSHARHSALLRIHGRLGGHFAPRNADLRLLGHSGTLAAEADLRVREDIVEVPEPVTAFAYMHLAEFILASDQREWLRLMREAEWYG
jgi:hypothetical protein